MAVPGHDPPIEITVFMDILINLGPICHKIPVRTTVKRQVRNWRRRSFVNNSIQIASRCMSNLIRVPICKNTSVQTVGGVALLKISVLI